MRSVVIFESMYGNTHAVADEIGQGLLDVGTVQLGIIEDVPPADIIGADLLVVGGPTHMHGLATPSSRQAATAAAEKDPDLNLDDDASGPGLREWLKNLPAGQGGTSAAFDTRLDKPALFTGSAAKAIAKRLRRKGFEPLADPESFLVADSAGPLLDGELTRARHWGERLAMRCRARRGDWSATA